MTAVDDRLLGELDAALRDAAPAVLDDLGAGIEEKTLADIDAHFGGRLPRDLKAWWRHYGGGPAEIAPGYIVWSAMGMLERYEKRRAMAERLARDQFTDESLTDPDIWWPRSWLPLIESGDSISIDLAATTEEAPLRYCDWEQISTDTHGSIVAPSLGDFLEEILGGYADDGYEYADGRRFIYDATVGAWRLAE